LVDFLTPGIFSEEFASQATIHPLTRESIIGYIPLVTNPKILMAHMSKYFSGNKALVQLVLYYISMITFAIDRFNYLKDHESLFKKQLLQLCDHFKSYKILSDYTVTSPNLTEKKVPLNECFEYILSDEGIQLVLRNRFPSDTKAIMKITDWLFPEIIYSKDKIIGLTNVLENFGFMFNKLKAKESLIPYLMITDNEYNHYVSPKNDLKSLIARIFWYNHDSNVNYANLKFQQALNYALNDSRYGSFLQKALLNESFYDPTCFEIAANEPNDESNIHFHFTEEMAFHLQTKSFFPNDCCICCKQKFNDSSELYHHLQIELGQYFMTTQRKVTEAILQAMNVDVNHEYKSYTIFRDEVRPSQNCPLTLSRSELFLSVKKKLEQKWGKHAPTLYTQYCKKSILFYLDNLLIFFRLQNRMI
jgi:hypothetical protein